MQPQPYTSQPVSHALDDWRALYIADIARVDDVLREMTRSTADLIPNIAQHIISSGGKRIRPILTLLSSALCGYALGDRHVRLAAAIEFLHTATLLHDDVVDESELRRGKPTANAVWGNAASVLVGDYMLSCAFQLMSRDGSLHVLRVLSDTSAIITEGEVQQLMAQQDITTTQAQYLSIISAKTAQLFAAACRVGAILGAEVQQIDNDAREAAMETYGRNLGIVFQIADDVLDYLADQKRLGKTLGDDFREGKVTLPVLLAYQAGNVEEKQFWERVIGTPHEQKSADLTQAIALLHKYNIPDACHAIMQQYSEDARVALDVFPASDYHTALLDILAFAESRQF